MTEAAIRSALSGLLDLCTMHAKPGAFHNGVTDSTGSIDEGDVLAFERIDAGKAALALPVTPAAASILAAFEKPPVADHDDDLCRSFGRKSFRLTFKVGAYEATHEAEVGGNVSGFDNLDCALMNLADRLYNEDAGTAVLTLTNPAGRKLTATDHKGGCEDWLRKLLVSATLFAITPETKDDEQ